MAEFVDPYVDPTTGVLRNLLGIADRAQLDLVEAEFTESRALDLDRHPVPVTADLAQLQAIHRALFQDVYPFAGELRTVELSKPGTNDSWFLTVSRIQQGAAYQFEQLAGEDRLRGLERDQFIERLAHHVNEVNYIHPFREGNGRTQRIFWSQIAEEAGYQIDWTTFTPDENAAAFRAAMNAADATPLTPLLQRAVSPVSLSAHRGRASAAVRAHRPDPAAPISPPPPRRPRLGR